MKIICDTNALLFWADRPHKLTPLARNALESGATNGNLACADISLWEIAMLFAKGRINPAAPVSPAVYMQHIIEAMRLAVLTITPSIAEIAQSGIFSHGDPADRLIAATAIHHGAPLITSDRELRALDTLETIW